MLKNVASRSSDAQYLEVLIVKSGEQWLAIRTKRLVRLMAFSSEQLTPPEETLKVGSPALVGSFSPISLPIFDLAVLLNLTEATKNLEGANAQVIIMEQGGLSVGFLVQAAQEIERASLKDLHLLPPLIKQSLLKPAVWAVWQRSAEEMLLLIDPTAALNELEWQLLARSSPVESR